MPGKAEPIETARNVGRSVAAPAVRRLHQRGFQRAYERAVWSLPGICDVAFRNRGTHLDVYTLYRGDIEAIEDRIYEIEAALMHAFPDVRPDWHLVEASDTEDSSAQGSARQALAFR